MKLKMSLLCIVSVLLISLSIKAQDHGFGIGFIVGEPTGISAKLWTSGRNAFDFGLGWSVGGDRITRNDITHDGSRIHFHMDYLWHSFRSIRSTERLPLYYGIGGRINSGGGYNTSFGVRGVFGIAWLPRSTPLDIFMEIAPVLQLVDYTGFGIDAGLGVRFYFN